MYVSSSNQCESYMWNLMCKYTCFLPDCFKDSKWTQGCELVQAGYSSCTVLIVYSNTSESKKTLPYSQRVTTVGSTVCLIWLDRFMLDALSGESLKWLGPPPGIEVTIFSLLGKCVNHNLSFMSLHYCVLFKLQHPPAASRGMFNNDSLNCPGDIKYKYI